MELKETFKKNKSSDKTYYSYIDGVEIKPIINILYRRGWDIEN